MEALLIGVAASLNFLVIYWKIEHKRFVDASLDAGILFMLTMMFNQSTGGMIIATIASAVSSLFLLVKKPELPIPNTDVKSIWEEFKTKLPQ